jgi:hypothetical protein
MFRAQMVFAVAELGIADALADGPKNAAQLAAATRTHPGPLRRVMRALVASGVFGEDAEGAYSLTPLSRMLTSSAQPSLRAMARFYGSAPVWGAWGQLTHALTTGGNPFAHVNGQPHFDYMTSHPADAAIFNQFMSSLPLFAGAMLHDYSNANLLVDVGGGHGNSVIPVLEANAHLRAILFELPHVAVGARAAIAGAGLAGRCDVAEGSFFDAVPAGGDVYLLSNIIHDWDDEHCARILANVRAAVSANGKLLVVEGIVPEGNQPHLMKLLDIQMLVMLGGQQRTEAEFRQLLLANGFELERVATVGMTNLIVAAPV